MNAAVDKPLMLFDGDCTFCRTWIAHWKTLTAGAVDYVPYQEAAHRFPEIDATRFRSAVQLVMPDGAVAQGAEAVFLSLRDVPGRGWLSRAYRAIPPFRWLTEAAYRLVASHRVFAAKATRLLWGPRLVRAEYVLSRWLFLRTLGALFCVSFVSYAVQLTGLIGADGILPAARFLSAAETAFGTDARWMYPTLAWFWNGDAALVAMACVGAALSVLVIAGVATRYALVGAYVLYLSLTVVGQTFLSFQWDALLLEMGILGALWAPRGLRPGFAKEDRPSTLVRWLLWLLLFRFMWNSGLVKILSGDQSWRDLTALSYHYLSQPLPNPLSWAMHHLPPWYHRAETFITLAFELAVPFMLFLPRRARFAAGGAFFLFQGFLQLTGNYTAFNLQAMALCIPLFDDAALRRMFPRRVADDAAKAAARAPRARVGLAKTARAMVLGTLLAGAVLQIVLLPFGRGHFVQAAVPAVGSLRALNVYGPFAVMTTTRPEIVIEGSDDGVTWKEYGFRYKVGDVMRAPPIVAPHHPRLDWQMWFLQFGDWRRSPWFANLMLRLLQGSPTTLALLETNPFPDKPPAQVRALRYDYRFTTPEEKAASGAWWVRTLEGEFFPAVTLRDFGAN